MSESMWLVEVDSKTTIHVRAWPKRPFCATKVYRDDDRNTFAINAKGKLFCNLVQKGRWSFRRPHRVTIKVLQGFATLGVLSKTQVAAIARAVEERAAREAKAYAASVIEGNAAEAGIALTSAQRRAINLLKAAAA